MNPIPLLKQLIALPSINPMGREIRGPEMGEGRVTAWLENFFRELGVEQQTVEVVPGRCNVLARFANPDSRTTVLLDAHQDTVPVDGMVIPPFEPTERDGRIYGRGSCDVKGGLAAMLAAFARLVKERPPGRANVIMSCTCDEESTSLGVYDLVKHWTVPARALPWLNTPPDFAIIAEPTKLDVVVAHRGVTRWKIRTTGRACHSSRPSEGINAIYRMAEVLRHVEAYAHALPTTRPAHPLCGPVTMSVGRVEGGTSVNMVPDWCAIEIDRRVIPGEDNLGVIDEVAEYLRERIDFDVPMDPPWITSPPLSDATNGPLADRLLEQVTAVAGPHRKIGVPYGTHASRTERAGVPSVVFGPGDIAQAHTEDEWIEAEQVHLAAEVYYQFCAQA